MLPAAKMSAQLTEATPVRPRRWLEFVSHLARKHSIKSDLLAKVGPAEQSAGEVRLRALWELTDLSAGDFADEVAGFFELRRMSLPEILAAPSLAARFSGRFLRERAIYPCRGRDVASDWLVMADPGDLTAVRGAEIVVGGPVTIAVASFEDIATVLSERLGRD